MKTHLLCVAVGVAVAAGCLVKAPEVTLGILGQGDTVKAVSALHELPVSSVKWALSMADAHHRHDDTAVAALEAVAPFGRTIQPAHL